MKELTCKVVLLGKESTGKTCLCAKFLSNEFRWGHSVTVGASYAAKKVLSHVLQQFLQLTSSISDGKSLFPCMQA